MPCTTDVPALEAAELAKLHRQVPGWELVGGRHLNRVGDLAEGQDHHPDVAFGWGWAEIKVFTHSIDGLTENDFILAAKVDLL